MSKYKVKVDGKDFEVDIQPGEGLGRQVVVNGKTYRVEVESKGGAPRSAPVVRAAPAAAAPVATAPMPTPAATGAGTVVAPLPGKILRVVVKVGDEVAVGDTIAVLEAMKMENNVPAPTSGKVTAVHVAAGVDVAQNQAIAEIG